MVGDKDGFSQNFTEEKLTKTLQKATGCESITITSIKTGDGTKKGDSYLSSTNKFTIEATGLKNNRKEDIFLPVIVKSVPKNVARRKTFRSVDFFETEIYFYEKLWPLMKKVKDQKNLSEEYEVPLALSLLFDNENSYIALEDISYKGYGTAQRDKGTGSDYALLLLRLLANFHALAIAAKTHDPTFEKVALGVKETYFHEKFRKWYIRFQQEKLNNVIRNAVAKELDPSYLEKINKLYEGDYYGKLCKLTHIRNKLSVISQGDCWLPNFLVKHENGKPKHAVLIDFQLARFTTLSNDLINILYGCVSEDVLLTQWDALVEEYHKYLSQRLSELGCDKNLITLDELKKDMQKHSLLGISMSMENLIMALLDDDEITDLDKLPGTDEIPLETVWDIAPFKDKLRNKKVAFVIKHAVDKGFIR